MFGTYNRLNVPVWASNREVIKAFRSRLITSALTAPYRDARHKLIRQILAIHSAQQQLCATLKI